MNAHSSFIFNSPKLEATQMSIYILMNRLWYIHTMEYNLTIERKGTMDTSNNMDESQNNYAESKKPDQGENR